MSGRPEIVGDNAGPTDPFPHRMEGTVIAGFGRGSSEVSPPSYPGPKLPKGGVNITV